MSDVDVGAEMTKVARALNKVKTNGAAAIAISAALEHAGELAKQAGRLPDLFRGAAAGSALKRKIEADATTLRGKAAPFQAPSLAAAPVSRSWEDTRNAIVRLYEDGTAIYAAGDLDVSLFRALIGNLDQTLVEYGNKLEDAGLAAPGVLIGDALHAVGTTTGKVAEGAAAGVADVGKGATSIVFGGILKGFWPVLIVAGVGAALYFGAPILGPMLARKALAR
jgi:hypothetical protein